MTSLSKTLPLFWLTLWSSNAWVIPSPSSFPAATNMRLTTRLFATVDKGGKSSEKGNKRPEEEFDLEQTRAALECLMAKGGNAHQEASSSSLHIVTSAGRHRRQLEMDLLQQMFVEGSNCLWDDDNDETADNDNQMTKEDDDDQTCEIVDDDDNGQGGKSRAVDELMHLWMYEHDKESALQLEAMQIECSPGMVKEEEQLRQMRARYPTWAEPCARLAILLYMKGVSEEAYDLALEALELKPWHFEVYPILVMLCLRHDNMGQALYWARRSYPSYRPGSKANARNRKAWVESALRAAAAQWEEAERQTLMEERRCGALDGVRYNGRDAGDEDGSSSWQ